MKLDDLVKVYLAAYERHPDFADEVEGYVHSGIRAVVAALRDEMLDNGIWTENKVEAWMNEILGSDAVEPTVGQRLIKAAHEAAAIARGEAAGGPTSNAGATDPVQANDHAVSVLPTPAADVCEWRPHHATGMGMLYVGKCDRELHFATMYGSCPSCGKPISFKDTP